MNNEERLIEVMAELLAEVHDLKIGFTNEVKGLREDSKEGFRALTEKVEKLEQQQAKTNLSIQELRLSMMEIANFGERIVKLEQEVFRKAS